MQRAKLALATGRIAYLSSLRQSNVYDGLLEGLPTREMNRETIDYYVEDARDRTGRQPFLIEPVQTPIEYEGRYPFGEPAKLPPIVCVAELVSSGRTPLYSSHLTVIWFQDDYAFPIDTGAEATIRAIEWERVSTEVEI